MYFFLNWLIFPGNSKRVSNTKDRNGKELTEAEEIKKSCKVYTEEMCKKGLNDTDNYDGVVIHLEQNNLECEVKWTLRNKVRNKASGGDQIPAELFQILKMMLLKCCTQQVNKFGKLSNGHWTEKGCFSFQFQRLFQRMFQIPYDCTHFIC